MSLPHNHPPITPDRVASADRMHARGRELFGALVRDCRAHRDTCDVPECHVKHSEEVAVAKVATEIFVGMFMCGHDDCAERNIQAVCEALAYVGVRTAEGRPLNV